MHLRTLLSGRICLLAACVLFAAGPAKAQQGVSIGYRNDNSGVFPADCQPVLSWSEEQNVLWKTPMPNYSNSTPIVVGGKVFTLSEPGWEHDAPLAICLDAQTGKLLWQRELV